MLMLLPLTGCIAVRGSADADFEGGTVPESEDEIYLLYPHLFLLQKKLDTASAYYYLGDLESSFNLSDDLIMTIGEMRRDADESVVCDQLDLLEQKAICLRQRIADEEAEREWRTHLTAVLDSIGRNHVVEEEIEVVENWRTEYWLNYFQGKGRKNFQRWLDRVETYRRIIEPILVDLNMPRDLLYLAVIESGLNLNAYSRAKAVGPWQFMAGTARLFGLRINWWIDERKDIVASTYAAAHYLKHLYSLFGSWPLALAAYNTGEYRVAYAISSQKTDDYWRLNLPSQTKWFVPKFMAALAIGREPERYGFRRSDESPLEFDCLSIDRSIDLRQVASGCECTVTRLKSLNPALKRWATPPGMTVELKIPRGTGEACLAKLESIPEDELVSWHRHTVREGETLSRIAAKYEISVSELKRLNGISNVHRIRAGHILLIPVKDADEVVASTSEPSYRTPPQLPDKITLKRYQAPSGYTKIVYTVKDKDTLSEIAERFHVGLSRLRSWNGLRYTSVIHPGDRLAIYLPPESPLAQGGDAAPSPPDEPQANGKKRVVHIVRRGDTLTSISRLYSTRISDILTWNDGIKRDRLYPGDRITIWLDGD